MNCRCFKCGSDNRIDQESIDAGYEAYRCWGCMSLAFIPNSGLYTYMARTRMNEGMAYSDLHRGEPWIVDGKSWQRWSD